MIYCGKLVYKKWHGLRTKHKVETSVLLTSLIVEVVTVGFFIWDIMDHDARHSDTGGGNRIALAILIPLGLFIHLSLIWRNFDGESQEHGLEKDLWSPAWWDDRLEGASVALFQLINGKIPFLYLLCHFYYMHTHRDIGIGEAHYYVEYLLKHLKTIFFIGGLALCFIILFWDRNDYKMQQKIGRTGWFLSSDIPSLIIWVALTALHLAKQSAMDFGAITILLIFSAVYLVILIIRVGKEILKPHWESSASI